MIRVGWIAGEPTPYRAPQLDAVAALPDIDLTVVYAAPTVQRRSWNVEVHHRAVFLEGRSVPAMRLLHHDYPMTPGVGRLLERERFDCLVIAGWSLFATQTALVWARLRDVPYLVVAESHLHEPRPGWIRGLRRLVLPRIVAPAAGHLVTGSLAREHALAYGADADRIVIFPNTVDVAELGRRADALRPERPRLRARLGLADADAAVLSVARLIPFKALDLLIEAVADARERSRAPLRLVLVGDGPEREALARRARERGLPVTFAGFLAAEDLTGAYVAADVFALLSRREPWGVVVNEAAACGLPLVLSDAVGASADLLEPGRNGLLVRSGDRAAAADALARLADDPELRAAYGARSRELVSDWGYDASLEAFGRLVRTVTRAR